MQILGNFAIMAAFAGFAVFASHFDVAYGAMVAIIVALSVLIILIATGRVRLAIGYRSKSEGDGASLTPGILPSLAPRAGALAIICAVLIVVVLTLRSMSGL